MARSSLRAAASAMLAAVLVGFSACGPGKPPAAKPIGEAYVAPEILQLRQEISPRSAVVATVRQGERVEILQRRRRSLRVRTAAKQEGWTEQNLLLTPAVFAAIAGMARQAASLPSFGVYKARDKLNIHLDPYRSSPAIYQLKENDKVDLLGRQTTERNATKPPAVPSTSSAPAPHPPEPSGGEEENSGEKAKPEASVEKPKAYDDWCLVRTSAGEPHAGWVLAQMIDADIPDEVAQYAEGRRITSYLPLSEVRDGDQTKKIWLWTTVEEKNTPYDFDSFRVFTWGRRRHRYETAYIERRLTGFFPVSVQPDVKSKYGAGPGFSLVIEKKDGKRYLRHYILLNTSVRFYGDEPASPPPPITPQAAPPPLPEPPKPGLVSRLLRKFSRKPGKS